MKKLLLFLIGLIAVALVAAWFSLGFLITTAVEKGGSKMLGTEVRLQDASVSPLSGEGSIQTLIIKNPEGFQEDYALAVEEAHVKVDLRSLLTDTIRIESVTVRYPSLIYETTGKESNFDRLIKNVKQAEEKKQAPETTPEPGKETAPEAKGKKVVIDRLIVTDGTVRLAVKGVADVSATVTLPPIQLNNIGKGGESPEKIIEVILREVLKATLEVLPGSARLEREVRETLEDVKKFFE